MKDAATATRIVHAELRRFALPLRSALRTPGGSLHEREIRLLLLHDESGRCGCGEASRVDWLSTGLGDDESAFAKLLERVNGDAPRAGLLLNFSMEASQPPALRAALQTALLDLEAQRRGTTLAALLADGPTPSQLTLSALIGDGEPGAMADEASRHARRGLGSFKMKVGRAGTAADVERADALRDAVGSKAELRFDANGAWTPAEADAALEALAGFHPVFVEEPLHDATRIAELSSRVAVALDESVHDREELDAALARKAGNLRCLVLKLERVGGPLAALSLARRASSAGIDVVFTDSIESRVGRAAALHTAAAFYGSESLEPLAVGLGGLFLLDDGDDAAAHADIAGPGLGVAAP